MYDMALNMRVSVMRHPREFAIDIFSRASISNGRKLVRAAMLTTPTFPPDTIASVFRQPMKVAFGMRQALRLLLLSGRRSIARSVFWDWLYSWSLASSLRYIKCVSVQFILNSTRYWQNVPV